VQISRTAGVTADPLAALRNFQQVTPELAGNFYTGIWQQFSANGFVANGFLANGFLANGFLA
jgi:hypothetical protein